MDRAPKDGRPILGLCVHGADPYLEDEQKRRLTVYAGHAEGVGHVPDGPHVIQWGGAFDDSTYESPGAYLPDWWFQYGTDFEKAANPVAWAPIPEFSLEENTETTVSSHKANTQTMFCVATDTSSGQAGRFIRGPFPTLEDALAQKGDGDVLFRVPLGQPPCKLEV